MTSGRSSLPRSCPRASPDVSLIARPSPACRPDPRDEPIVNPRHATNHRILDCSTSCAPAADLIIVRPTTSGGQPPVGPSISICATDACVERYEAGRRHTGPLEADRPGRLSGMGHSFLLILPACPPRLAAQAVPGRPLALGHRRKPTLPFTLGLVLHVFTSNHPYSPIPSRTAFRRVVETFGYGIDQKRFARSRYAPGGVAHGDRFPLSFP